MQRESVSKTGVPADGDSGEGWTQTSWSLQGYSLPEPRSKGQLTQPGHWLPSLPFRLPPPSLTFLGWSPK